eukprot:gene13165-27849_t
MKKCSLQTLPLKQQHEEDLTTICGAKRELDESYNYENVENSNADKCFVEAFLTRKASEVISLTFQSALGDVTLSPDFTHQLFDDESISLHPPALLKLDICINCWNMNYEIKYEHESTATDSEKAYIINRISPALPEELSTTSSYPPGRIIHSFIQNNISYEIRLANHHDIGATELHNSVAKLALWFIETADSINFNDDRWEVLFILQRNYSLQHPTENENHSENTNINTTTTSTSTTIAKTTSTDSSDTTANMSTTTTTSVSYCCVGYFTLFTFINPLVGSRIRVCQALILPPYQRKKLGQHMLLCVYRLAQDRDAVVEVTVEDPAPGFQILRNK